MNILKPLTAITAYYTGDNGTYCSVMPDAETARWIAALCDTARSMGFDATSPFDQHVTVIHSKKGLTVPQQKEIAAAGFSAARVFTATAQGAIHWAGHDDEGYVVMELESQELRELNGWLRSEYNLPVSFDDYRAHVTIATDAYRNSKDFAEQLCEVLNSMPRPAQLRFTGLRVEDLK